jgi:hypothetical protein
LLLRRQRFANGWLARLLGGILRYPAANGACAYAHALADMSNAEALFFNRLDDLQLKARIKTVALPRQANLLGWRIVHLSRCPGKFDHYIFLVAGQTFISATAAVDIRWNSEHALHGATVIPPRPSVPSAAGVSKPALNNLGRHTYRRSGKAAAVNAHVPDLEPACRQYTSSLNAGFCVQFGRTLTIARYFF